MPLRAYKYYTRALDSVRQDLESYTNAGRLRRTFRAADLGSIIKACGVKLDWAAQVFQVRGYAIE